MVTKEEFVILGSQSLTGLSGLQNNQSSHRLNQIDQVRALGVGDHISLPQIAVCGDQSAGKSSVLEGITGIPFPRKEGVCTRFATEIILRHQPEINRIIAKILPSISRTAPEKERIASFERQLASFDELPAIIEEVSVLMGISAGSEAESGPCTFADDILRLEVTGNTGLHLTVVDLPGLISFSENPTDVDVVANLVDNYLRSSRTIILAVIPASSDIDTQKIIQRAREFDGTGSRTVGIITKPDLINKGTESRIADFTRNAGRVKLTLGYFLVKNPSPTELNEGLTESQRLLKEKNYFNSSPWSEQDLDKDRVGFEQLRTFLQELLANHIEKELPKVRQEIQALHKSTEEKLQQIGPERSSVPAMRSFLIHLSMKFHTLAKAASDGDYLGESTAFFETGRVIQTRLRARVHKENETFAAFMRTSASKRKICEEDNTLPESEGQILLSRKQMIEWIEQVSHAPFCL